MQKTCIIVPCYNESRRLRTAEFLNYAKKTSNVYFIFVNDGSSDDTLKIIKKLSLSFPDQISCISLPKNKGKSEAVRQGFLKAMEMDFRNIGFWDADLSTPLDHIARLCNILDSPQILVVLGSRVKLLGRKIERKAIRHYLGRVFATLASLFLQLPVYDTQCGAKVFKNNDLLKKIFSIPFYVKWTFDVEILARYKIINKRKLHSIETSVVEYPLHRWTHISGSKVKLVDFFRIGLELIILFAVLYFPGISDQYSRKLN